MKENVYKIHITWMTVEKIHNASASQLFFSAVKNA
jgi:hypothetical protein